MKIFGRKGGGDAPPTDAPLDGPDLGIEETDIAGADVNADAPLDLPPDMPPDMPSDMPPDMPPDDNALAAPARGGFAGGGGDKKKLIAVAGLLVVLAALGGGGYFYLMGEDSNPNPTPVADVTPPAAAPAPAPATQAAAVTPPALTPPATASAPPLKDPLDPSNPNEFAGGPPQPPAPASAVATAPAIAAPAIPDPVAAAAPGTATAAAPATTTSPAPAATPGAEPALGPPPAEEAAAIAVPPSPSSPAPAAAGPAVEAAAEEPPQDLPMPAGEVPAPGAAAVAAPVAPVAGTPPPAAPATPGVKTGTGEPSEAEKAIVQNAAALDQLAPPATPGTAARPFDPNGPAPDQGKALKAVDALLEQPAIVRPMPPSWLTVKKERDADDVDTRLTVARTALAQNNSKGALQLFTELGEKYPKDKRILMGKAVALQKLGQYDQALVAYEDVLNHDPKNLEALTNMLGLLKSKDPRLALDKLIDLRETYPYNGDITAQLAIAYANAGEYEQALRYFDMAEALEPGSAYVLYNKAVLYDKMGRSQQAGELYRQVIRLAADGQIDQNLPLDAIRKRLAVLR